MKKSTKILLGTGLTAAAGYALYKANEQNINKKVRKTIDELTNDKLSTSNDNSLENALRHLVVISSSVRSHKSLENGGIYKTYETILKGPKLEVQDIADTARKNIESIRDELNKLGVCINITVHKDKADSSNESILVMFVSLDATSDICPAYLDKDLYQLIDAVCESLVIEDIVDKSILENYFIHIYNSKFTQQDSNE